MGHSFSDIKDLHGVRFKASPCPAGDFTRDQRRCTPSGTGAGRGRGPSHRHLSHPGGDNKMILAPGRT